MGADLPDNLPDDLPHDLIDLLERLKRLEREQFDELVLRLGPGIDRSQLLPDNVPVAARAVELLHVYRQGGRDRAELVAALETVEAGGVALGPSPPVACPAAQVVLSRAWPSASPTFRGREAELGLLDRAWAGEQQARCNVVVFAAMGGTGKTALVGRWLAHLAQDGYRGSARVLAWSFYSQGTSDDRNASSDAFVDWALRQLGDPDPTIGSPFDKIDRLVRLVRGARTLLVLDGVEPLQRPPGPDEGKFRDPAMAKLVCDLCLQSVGAGLCVITSRMRLADLAGFEGKTARTIDLAQLDPVVGAQLLVDLGARGSDAELRQASEEFGNHALALTLLGTLLVASRRGDIRCRREIPPLVTDDVRGGHAKRVMESYERWLSQGDGAEEAQRSGWWRRLAKAMGIGRRKGPPSPEVAILYLLGFFDRPAPAAALEALRAAPAIAGLTESLVSLASPVSDDTATARNAWATALERLRRARLVEPAGAHRSDGDADAGADTIDAHPLVREHFGQKLRTTAPEAWREGHRRLYEHYRATAKELPDTLDEMAPLYAAVVHGCHAGQHQEALDEVYKRRICRSSEFYSVSRLGAFGAGLATLSGFFAELWTRPVPSLIEGDRAYVLCEAGFDLRALGRLREAAGPMRAALDARIVQKDWNNAAIGAGQLCDLHLTLGEVERAIEYARQSVEFADRGGDPFWRMARRTTLADALHQAQGAGQTGGDPVGQAAGAVVAAVGEALGGTSEAEALIVFGLGLGLRPAAHPTPPDLAAARRDHTETKENATRGSMRLHETDAHLGLARLALAERDPTTARHHLDAACALVTATGYHRRDPDLADIAARLAQLEAHH